MDHVDAIINIDGTEYALHTNGPMSKYPYMVDLSTGEIPYREQRTLLRRFLSQKGIVIDKENTHQCIRKAIELTA